MITQKKRVKEVRLHVPGKDAYISIDGSQAYLMADGSSYPFGSNSGILILLIENRNREVSRAELLKMKEQERKSEEEYADNIITNGISNIRKLLKKEAGMKDSDIKKLIVTSGQSEGYKVRLILEEKDLKYDDAFEMEPYVPYSAARSGWDFPALQFLTGGRQIKTEYLPSCTLNSTSYRNLESCIRTLREKQENGIPVPSSIILSARGGAGKTFSMFHLYGAAESLGIRPIYVHAMNLEEEEHNLLHYISRKYLHEADYHRHEDTFENFMRHVRRPVLLLVDGMNEISTKKQEYCCKSFKWMAEAFPAQIGSIFSTRFPQWLRSMLYETLEIQLQPLKKDLIRDHKQSLLSRLHVELTPLLLDILDRIEPSQLNHIHSHYDLYQRYFDDLADRAYRKNSDGWIYDVLAHAAAKSMEGEIINNRWLRKLCSDQGEYDFIHSWCAGEEYPLEDPSTVEKLKATGFLEKGFGDVYTFHQKHRDYLTIRYALLMMHCGALDPADFLAKIIEATRYFTISEKEDQAYINFRRHNNMDLGEYGFYAGLDWYREHGKPDTLIPLLVQLGVQVAYLYDNVRNLEGLYDLHCQLDDLLARCLKLGADDARMNAYLPGYYFCLNKLVSFKHKVKNLSSLKQLLAFSEKLEEYYETWRKKAPHNPEHCAVAYSGLGGVYLARFHIQPDFESKHEDLSKAIEYHTKAMKLRRNSGSPKLYLSHTALGTDYFHKGCLYLSDKETDRTQEALNVFRAAAEQHFQAVQQAENPEKYVSWTRMAGCWYKLYQNTPEAMTGEREEYRREIAAAAASSYNCLKASTEKGGVIHLSSEIHALLRDISRYMPLLSRTEADKTHIDHLCDLYHQAFPDRPKPVRCEDDKSIIF
ncbi:MAG: winged helix-turn-helix domain-containing protein [Firmicutes bacterium]|nr:winged helix-turn-helix domain-containing protein [Bacillota bacterium]